MRHIRRARVLELEPAGARYSPVLSTTIIGGVTYTGQTCAPCGLRAFNGHALPARVLDPNFHQPFAAEWNLDIQRAITNKLTVDVAYVGNHGYDIENIDRP